MSEGGLGPELERLPGVLAATVVETAHGPTIYLAAAPGARADAVRAAALAVLRRRGVHPHPDAVRVGTVPNPTAAAGRPIHDVSLDDVDVRRAGSRVHCVVRVRSPRGPLTGSDTDTDSPTGRARAAARAALASVEPLEPDLRLGLHGARPIDLFGMEAVTVLVEAILGRSHVHLPGTVLVHRSLEEAAALAALHALRSWTP